jgi:hypothetical protein
MAIPQTLYGSAENETGKCQHPLHYNKFRIEIQIISVFTCAILYDPSIWTNGKYAITIEYSTPK